ncbi:MAG: pilus assembly protein PilP [Desulfuromonadales bacterium]|nr:pilus assembly protein PilP [Desulfuromonadales bacterium]
MIRWYVYLICGVLIFTGPIGCSEEPTPAPRQQSVAVKTPPPATQVPAPESIAEEKEEDEFVYFAEGRRDPFVPLSTIRRPIAVSAEPDTPLQSYDLDQFRLVGVIVGKGASKAMVIAPDGKSYVLAKGVKIGKNNGVVVGINSEVILVEEKYYDFSGNVIENIQEIAVPKREGA